MKTLILSTIAAAAIALSAGTALASENSSDNGFEIYRQSLNLSHKAPSGERQFLSSGPADDGSASEPGVFTGFGAGPGSPGHRDSSH